MGILGIDGCLPPGAAPACDGFVLCGGAKLWPYHLQILDHAFQTGKPVLGVCLGMQAMSAYFKVREQAALRHWEGSLLALFDRLKQEGYLFTRPVARHWEVNITRDNIPATKHRVLLQEGTLLRQLLGRNAFTAPPCIITASTAPLPRCAFRPWPRTAPSKGWNIAARCWACNFIPKWMPNAARCSAGSPGRHSADAAPEKSKIYGYTAAFSGRPPRNMIY